MIVTLIGDSIRLNAETNEATHNARKPSRRYYADLLEYNRRSARLANRFGFHINDLFTPLTELDIDTLLLPDGVHFNTRGNRWLGRRIARAVRDHCSVVA